VPGGALTAENNSYFSNNVSLDLGATTIINFVVLYDVARLMVRYFPM
jgi:hypothetical protein